MCKQMIRAFFSLFLLLFLIQCSIVLPPTTGSRSAHNQLLESESLDESLEQIAWPSHLNGAKVYLHLHALNKSEVSSDYLDTVLINQLLANGIMINQVQDQEDAEFIINGQCSVLGSDTFVPNQSGLSALLMLPINMIFKYDYKYKSYAKMNLSIYSNRSSSYKDSFDCSKVNHMSQYRILFGLIGPIKNDTSRGF